MVVIGGFSDDLGIRGSEDLVHRWRSKGSTREEESTGAKTSWCYGRHDDGYRSSVSQPLYLSLPLPPSLSSLFSQTFPFFLYFCILRYVISTHNTFLPLFGNVNRPLWRVEIRSDTRATCIKRSGPRVWLVLNSPRWVRWQKTSAKYRYVEVYDSRFCVILRIQLFSTILWAYGRDIAKVSFYLDGQRIQLSIFSQLMFGAQILKLFCNFESKRIVQVDETRRWVLKFRACTFKVHRSRRANEDTFLLESAMNCHRCVETLRNSFLSRTVTNLKTATSPGNSTCDFCGILNVRKFKNIYMFSSKILLLYYCIIYITIYFI